MFLLWRFGQWSRRSLHKKAECPTSINPEHQEQYQKAREQKFAEVSKQSRTHPLEIDDSSDAADSSGKSDSRYSDALDEIWDGSGFDDQDAMDVGESGGSEHEEEDVKAEDTVDEERFELFQPQIKEKDDVPTDGEFSEFPAPIKLEDEKAEDSDDEIFSSNTRNRKRDSLDALPSDISAISPSRSPYSLDQTNTSSTSSCPDSPLGEQSYLDTTEDMNESSMETPLALV